MIESRAEVDIVRERLEEYARRGVFRGFSAAPTRSSRHTFRMIWHRDRPFELILDVSKGELRFVNLLPQLAADSPVYSELKAFIKSRQSSELPEHRRIDPARSQVRVLSRSGNVSLALRVLDDDYDYGAQKIIHLVQEIFLTFLSEGLNLEYAVETFELDPDRL